MLEVFWHQLSVGDYLVGHADSWLILSMEKMPMHDNPKIGMCVVLTMSTKIKRNWYWGDKPQYFQRHIKCH